MENGFYKIFFNKSQLVVFSDQGGFYEVSSLDLSSDSKKKTQLKMHGLFQTGFPVNPRDYPFVIDVQYSLRGREFKVQSVSENGTDVTFNKISLKKSGTALEFKRV
jgi:hypothetical protein